MKKKFKRSAKHSIKSVKQEEDKTSALLDFPSPVDNARRLFQEFEISKTFQGEVIRDPTERRFSTSCFTMTRVGHQSLMAAVKQKRCSNRNFPKTTRSISKLKHSLREKVQSLRESNLVMKEEKKIPEVKYENGRLSLARSQSFIMEGFDEESESSQSLKTVKGSTNKMGGMKKVMKKIYKKMKKLKKEVKQLKKKVRESEEGVKLGKGVKNIFLVEDQIGKEILKLMKRKLQSDEEGDSETDSKIVIIEYDEKKSQIVQDLKRKLEEEKQENEEKAKREILKKRLQMFKNSLDANLIKKKAPGGSNTKIIEKLKYHTSFELNMDLKPEEIQNKKIDIGEQRGISIEKGSRISIKRSPKKSSNKKKKMQKNTKMVVNKFIFPKSSRDVLKSKIKSTRKNAKKKRTNVGRRRQVMKTFDLRGDYNRSLIVSGKRSTFTTSKSRRTKLIQEDMGKNMKRNFDYLMNLNRTLAGTHFSGKSIGNYFLEKENC